MEDQTRIQHAISFLMSLPEEELHVLLKELGCDMTQLEDGAFKFKPPRSFQ